MKERMCVGGDVSVTHSRILRSVREIQCPSQDPMGTDSERRGNRLLWPASETCHSSEYWDSR